MQILKTVDEQVYLYTESIWTGKKELIINGTKLQKIGKNRFIDGEKNYFIKGHFLKGVTLITPDKEVVLSKYTWYEFIMIYLPLASFALGIFCGAIGGGLCGMFSIFAHYLTF